MINIALTTAFTDASLHAPGWPSGASAAPYMTYDARAGGLVSLFAQTTYDSTNPTPIEIFFDINLYTFFDNFLINFYGEGLANKKDIQMIVQNLYNNTYSADTKIPNGWYEMAQEYPRLYSWWDTESIVFKSSLIGVRNEFTPTQNISPSSLVGGNTAGVGPSESSNLTDFVASFPVTDPGGYRSQLVYIPAFYRLVDLLSNTVRGIDISIYWTDKQNNQHLYYLPPMQVVSIKLAFVKKSLYKNALRGPSQIKNPLADVGSSSRR